MPQSRYCNSNPSTKEPGRLNRVPGELRRTRGTRFQALTWAKLLNDSFVKPSLTECSKWMFSVENMGKRDVGNTTGACQVMAEQIFTSVLIYGWNLPTARSTPRQLHHQLPLFPKCALCLLKGRSERLLKASSEGHKLSRALWPPIKKIDLLLMVLWGYSTHTTKEGPLLLLRHLSLTRPWEKARPSI